MTIRRISNFTSAKIEARRKWQAKYLCKSKISSKTETHTYTYTHTKKKRTTKANYTLVNRRDKLRCSILIQVSITKNINGLNSTIRK
jgi:hypothetical protein